MSKAALAVTPVRERGANSSQRYGSLLLSRGWLFRGTVTVAAVRVAGRRPDGGHISCRDVWQAARSAQTAFARTGSLRRGHEDTRIYYTIGHSTRTTAELVGMLHLSQVRLIVDVRSIPRSRTNPWFNSAPLAGALKLEGIEYQHNVELGGRRARTAGADPSVNAYWRVQAFHNYADYALTPAFACGLMRLCRYGDEQTCAIMCSEAVWWRCHRRIITDYLLASGRSVTHILGPARIEAATMTLGAIPGGDGRVCYPKLE